MLIGKGGIVQPRNASFGGLFSAAFAQEEAPFDIVTSRKYCDDMSLLITTSSLWQLSVYAIFDLSPALISPKNNCRNCVFANLDKGFTNGL